MKRLLMLSAAVTLGGIVQPAMAHDYTAGDLQIIHPTAFETPKTAQAAAGYMVISNNGDTDDTLLEVRADFPRVMIHTTETQDGVARMIHLENLPIPAGDVVELAPGGNHVMFMGLNGDPFEVGEDIPLTLVFEKAGEVEVVIKVIERETEAKGADHSDHSGHDDHSGHKDHSTN